MKYCSKCGNILKNEDVFCSRCGAKTSVFGVSEKPNIKPKTGVRTKVSTDTDAPGARYTAAIEKNAVAVTEYLKGASDLEWQIYKMGQISKELMVKKDACLREIEKEEQAISNYKDKAAQTERKIKDYKKQDYRRKVFNSKVGFDLMLFVKIFGGLLLIFAIGGIATVPPFSWVFNLLVGAGAGGAVSGGGIFRAIVLLLLIPAIAVMIIQVIKYYRNKAEHERNEDEATIRYEEEQARLEKESLESYNNDLNDYNNIIAQRENEKARLENVLLKSIEDERTANKAVTAEAGETLEKYYSNQVLFPKYRGLVPVNTMLAYFQSGRAKELTGHGGAYNIYENDLKQGLIATQLEALMADPETLNEYQKAIPSKIGLIENQVAELMDSVQKVGIDNLTNNPNGFELSKKLRHSRELEACYEAVRAGLRDHMEYIDDINRQARHWF